MFELPDLTKLLDPTYLAKLFDPAYLAYLSDPAYLAYFAGLMVATLLDLPTLVTIAACTAVKRFAYVVIIAVVVAMLTHIASRVGNPEYEFQLDVYLTRPVGQLLVGLLTFWVTRRLRRWKERRRKEWRRQRQYVS